MYSQVKFNGFRRRLRKRKFWESLVQGRVSNRFSRGFPALGFAAHFGKNDKKCRDFIRSNNKFYFIELT